MNTYVFERVTETVLRVISFEEDSSGCKSVKDIVELNHENTKEGIKKIVSIMYNWLDIGHDGEDYCVRTSLLEYDSSLEGKARKKSSKEINVIVSQLMNSI
jgi:hypothetical protein